MDSYNANPFRRNSVTFRSDLTDAAKNWLAMDGLWFQAVEEAYGMEAALAADRRVWEQFSVIEARRIMERQKIREEGGLDALAQALEHRLYFYLNEQEIQRPDREILILMMRTCRVQAARERKKMPAFPCRSIGLIEYAHFARTIDRRIVTSCISCPPDNLPEIPYCAWKFTLAPTTTG